MRVIVQGYRRGTDLRADPDYTETVELLERLRAPAHLARRYFARWPDAFRIRIYDELGVKLGSYLQVTGKPGPKPKPRRSRKRTGWDAHRGRHGI